MDMVLIPAFWDPAKHWLCAVIDIRKREVLVYDSAFYVRRIKPFYRVRVLARGMWCANDTD